MQLEISIRPSPAEVVHTVHTHFFSPLLACCQLRFSHLAIFSNHCNYPRQRRGMLPELPIEVLSHIVALVPPAYHPDQDDPALSTPPTFIIDALDPHPIPYNTSINNISAISKSAHQLLEASRPWLWEEVDVRSGRGWLAVVNALTEEVSGHVELPSLSEIKIEGLEAKLSAKVPQYQLPVTPISPETPLSYLPPHDADPQPNTVPGGFGHYIASTSQSAYPSAYTAGTASNALGATFLPQDHPVTPTFSYSPPQPGHASLLLTPPGSRTSSPRPGLTRQDTIVPASTSRDYSPSDTNGSSGSGSSHPPHPGLSRYNTITANFITNGSLAASRAAAIARLRGRSRSPRRHVGFDTEGISAVLDRSRSASAHGARAVSDGNHAKRIPLDRRRSSFSRSGLSRSRSVNTGYDDDDGADEEDDEVAPLSPSHIQAQLSPRSNIDDFDDNMSESQSNCNPELLPPPGPYIRHLSFNNFRTIGSRRTQEEAVRGRYVTAGRLEGVIKVRTLVQIPRSSDIPNPPNELAEPRPLNLPRLLG